MKILLIPNDNQKSKEVACQLMEIFTSHGDAVLMFESFAAIFGDKAEILPEKNCFENADICVVLGGDGAVLHAGKNAALYDVPVIAVNTGRVGFLAALEGCDADKIYEIIDDSRGEKRTMIEVKVISSDGKELFSDIALNEAVISRGEISRIIEIALSVNGKEINSVRGDGLVIATPTGSTAYSMSAGGPILSPEVAAMTVTPICPYTLAARATVLPDTAEISASLFGLGDSSAILTIDGNAPYSLEKDVKVVFKRSEKSLTLLMAGDAFYEKIKTKLFGV